jgi:hypothetical protein
MINLYSDADCLSRFLIGLRENGILNFGLKFVVGLHKMVDVLKKSGN